MSDRTALVFVVIVGAILGVLIVELADRSGLMR